MFLTTQHCYRSERNSIADINRLDMYSAYLERLQAKDKRAKISDIFVTSENNKRKLPECLKNMGNWDKW